MKGQTCFFNLTIALPLQPTASLENKKIKSFSHETAGNGSRGIRDMFSGVIKKRQEQGHCITIE